MDIHEIRNWLAQLLLPHPVQGGLPAVALLLSLALGTGPAYSSPGGELDASFGNNGRAGWMITEANYGHAIAQQLSDGKLLIAGSASSYSATGFNFAIVRGNADGSADGAFGSNGAVVIDLGGEDDYATDIAVQADGKIVVAGSSGTFGSGRDLALLRLNPNGSVDTTFGVAGRVTLDLGGEDDYIARIVLQQNGQIVVAGATNANGNYDAVFARFHADGTLDTAFGSGPTAGTTRILDSSRQDQPFWMTRQADGKYVACGQSGPIPYDAEGAGMLAVRINVDGSVDSGFGSGGIARIAAGTLPLVGRSCVALPGGTIVIAGSGGEPGDEDLLLARLLSDGRQDMTFGTAGLSRIDFGAAETVQSIIRLADGTLAISGLTGRLGLGHFPSGLPLWEIQTPDYDPSEFFVARLDATSGSLDPAFGNNGVTLVDFGSDYYASWAYARGLIQQVDGKLVAVGTQVYLDGLAGEIPVVAVARVDPAGGGNAGIAGFADWYTEVTEGTPATTIAVRRSGGSTGNLSVDYNTYDGSTQGPADYTTTSGTLTWMSGDADPKFITISIVDDTAGENDEAIIVQLSNSSNGLAHSQTGVRIIDNDNPPPPPPPPGPVQSGGGGGSSGTVLLALLVIFGVAQRRRNALFSKLVRIISGPL